MANPKKHKLWDQKRAEVDTITDTLGEKIDERIKDVVTAFRVHDFPTTASCEGHPESVEGLPYPWIEIESPEPQNWENDLDQQKEWRKSNLQQQKRMLRLLERFYQNRDPHLDTRLNFRYVGAFGAFRIQNLGAETMELLPANEKTKAHKQYLAELRDFGEFLLTDYLN